MCQNLRHCERALRARVLATKAVVRIGKSLDTHASRIFKIPLPPELVDKVYALWSSLPNVKRSCSPHGCLPLIGRRCSSFTYLESVFHSTSERDRPSQGSNVAAKLHPHAMSGDVATYDAGWQRRRHQETAT